MSYTGRQFRITAQDEHVYVHVIGPQGPDELWSAPVEKAGTSASLEPPWLNRGFGEGLAAVVLTYYFRLRWGAATADALAMRFQGRLWEAYLSHDTGNQVVLSVAGIEHWLVEQFVDQVLEPAKCWQQERGLTPCQN